MKDDKNDPVIEGTVIAGDEIAGTPGALVCGLAGCALVQNPELHPV